MQTQTVSMIILAGGKSSRMGREKSDLLYRGRSFLELQADKANLLHITDVLISGYRGAQQLPYPVLHDQTPEQGPLGGLATCLEAVHNDWALVLSVDAPLVPVSELENLMEFALHGGCRAAILRSAEREYPLIGMYHRSLAPAMREEIALRKGSVFAMLRRAGYGIYESTENPSLFSNVNDPESYQRLVGDCEAPGISKQ